MTRFIAAIVLLVAMLAAVPAEAGYRNRGASVRVRGVPAVRPFFVFSGVRRAVENQRLRRQNAALKAQIQVQQKALNARGVH